MFQPAGGLCTVSAAQGLGLAFCELAVVCFGIAPVRLCAHVLCVGCFRA
jgi:hypothetical protein